MLAQEEVGLSLSGLALAKKSGSALYQAWVMAQVIPVCSLGTRQILTLSLPTLLIQQEERNNPQEQRFV